MRRLPIYILIDRSASMVGEPIEAVKVGLDKLLSSLRRDPFALENVYLSLITFDENADVLVPITELSEFSCPEITLSNNKKRNLGLGLQLLLTRYEKEVKKTTLDEKGDWLPIVVLMTSGNPNDPARFKSVLPQFKKYPFAKKIVCIAGAKDNINILNHLTHDIFVLDIMDSHAFSRFWKWVSTLTGLQNSPSTHSQIILPPITQKNNTKTAKLSRLIKKITSLKSFPAILGCLMVVLIVAASLWGITSHYSRQKTKIANVQTEPATEQLNPTPNNEPVENSVVKQSPDPVETRSIPEPNNESTENNVATNSPDHTETQPAPEPNTETTENNVVSDLPDNTETQSTPEPNKEPTENNVVTNSPETTETQSTPEPNKEPTENNVAPNLPDTTETLPTPETNNEPAENTTLSPEIEKPKSIQLTVTENFNIKDKVSGVLFSPDGRSILTLIHTLIRNSSKEWLSKIKFVDIANGKELRQLKEHRGYVSLIAFSSDQKSILTVGDDGTARIWDVKTGKELRQLNHKSVRLNSAKFSPDGKLIVTSSLIGIAWIWNVETGELLHALRGHKRAIHSSEFSPDGKFVITSADDNIVRIWSVSSGETIKELPVSDVNFARYSPDGRFFVTIRHFGISVLIWDAVTYKQLNEFEGGSSWGKNISFSADGKFILTLVSFDKTARMWDTATGKELHKFQHADKVNSAEFAPDGRFVITASDDKTARIWDTATGKNLCTFEPAKNIKVDPFSYEPASLRQVKSASFSPDGQFIMTSTGVSAAEVSSGKNVIIWSLTENKEN